MLFDLPGRKYEVCLPPKHTHSVNNQKLLEIHRFELKIMNYHEVLHNIAQQISTIHLYSWLGGGSYISCCAGTGVL